MPRLPADRAYPRKRANGLWGARVLAGRSAQDVRERAEARHGFAPCAFHEPREVGDTTMMQNQVFAARARASRPTLVLLLMLALPGCGSSGDESDDSGVALDASSHVDAGPDASTTSAERETGTAQEDAAANTSACVPGCESTALCCVDAHGHLPRCVAEAVCPSGFKPEGN